MFTETGYIQKNRAVLQRLATCCVMLLCLFVTTVAFAKDYSFTWSANPDPVEGYKLYYKIDGNAVPPFDGTGVLQGPSPINVGKQTAFTITGLDDDTTYFFALTAYNGAEESGFSEIISVFAPEIAPVAIIVTPSLTGNAPFTLNLDGTSSTGALSTYSWTFGDGKSATGPTASHIYQFPGTYTATLAVESTSGLSHQATILVTVTEAAPPPPVNPTAVLSSSNAVGNAPLTVQFDGSASTSAQPPIVSYSWDFGDGAIAGGATVAHSYTIPGTYSAVLTITDNAGLTSQAKTPVMIGAAPLPEAKPPISSFIATPSSGTSPLIVAFNASGSRSPAGSISEYRWDFGDGTSAIGISPKHTFVAKANYLVTLKVTDNLGGTATSSGTISVLFKPANMDSTDNEDNVITPILYLLLLK